MQVICGIVGVPLEDSAQFHQWAEQINTGPLHPKVGMAASQAMRDYLEPIVEDRRSNPHGRPHQRPRARRDRRRAAHRREDLRLPPAAAPGGRGDDVPGDGQRARPRCSMHPDVMERVRRRPRPAARRDRGDAALGVVGHAGEPGRGGRHRDRRLPGPGGRGRRRAHRVGEPRRGALRARRRSSTSTARCRTTWRSGPASTSASACTSRASSCASASRRSSTGCRTCASTPTGRAAAHRGARVPRPDDASRSCSTPACVRARFAKQRLSGESLV